MIALYEFGALEEREKGVFLDHLVECEYCYHQVYSMEPIMTAFRDHRNAAARGEVDQINAVHGISAISRSRRPWQFAPAFAALSVALIVGGWFLYTKVLKNVIQVDPIQTAKARWDDVEIPKAAYVKPREGVTLRGPGTPFERAIAAYAAGDYAGAIGVLETLRELDEGATPSEVNFYLGVSLLLAGHPEDAIPPLNRVVDLGDKTRLEAARYYLALGYLKQDQPKKALAELDTVRAMKGRYLSDAEILSQLVSHRLQ